MKLKYYGSSAELQEIVAKVSPGGSWVIGYEISEYHSLEGPKIRCYPNGTVFVQGKDGPAGELFKRLVQVIKGREVLKGLQHTRRRSSS